MSDSFGQRFSVVIANYNAGSMLRDCVRSVIREGIRTADVVIVDNGSRDDSLLQLERDIPGTKIIRNPCNAGFARAVNQGLEVASREFILLLNNDAQLHSGCLRAFADAFDSLSGLAIAGGQLVYGDGQLQTSIASVPRLTSELIPHTWLKLISPRRFQGDRIGDALFAVESVVGACLAVRRSLLPELGPLDEDYFFYFEEIEWCQRARKLGFLVCHVPAARVDHLQGKTAKSFRNGSRIEYQRSKLTFYRKSQSLPVYFVLSTHLVLRALFNAIANTAFSVATIFSNKTFRAKTWDYWHSLSWHLLGRPKHWGLPEKCPPRK